MEIDAYVLRAMTYYSKGDPQRALADGLTALMIHPHDANARHLVDQILSEMDQADRDETYSSFPILKTDLDGGR